MIEINYSEIVDKRIIKNLDPYMVYDITDSQEIGDEKTE